MTIENNVAAQAGDEPMDYAEQLRAAVETVCEGWTLPPGARKTLEAALWAPQVSPRATADVERVMMDCLIALSIGYVQTNDAGDEVCPDCDVDHVGADHSPGCLVLRARAARAQLAAIATTKPGA